MVSDFIYSSLHLLHTENALSACVAEDTLSEPTQKLVAWHGEMVEGSCHAS